MDYQKTQNFNFGPFWGPPDSAELFLKKSGFVTFFILRLSNFIQKIRKIWWAISEILQCEEALKERNIIQDKMETSELVFIRVFTAVKFFWWFCWFFS